MRQHHCRSGGQALRAGSHTPGSGRKRATTGPCRHCYAAGKNNFFKLALAVPPELHCSVILLADAPGPLTPGLAKSLHGLARRLRWKCSGSRCIRRRSPRNKPVSGCVRRCASCRSPGRTGHSLPGVRPGRHGRGIAFSARRSDAGGGLPPRTAGGAGAAARSGPGGRLCLERRAASARGSLSRCDGPAVSLAAWSRARAAVLALLGTVAVDAAGIGVFLVLHGRPAKGFSGERRL